MKSTVHFFSAVARPAANNRKYKPWESAEIFVFIAEDDHEAVLQQFDDILNKHRWELLYFKRQETLIEERVRRAGTDAWSIYERAQRERGPERSRKSAIGVSPPGKSLAKAE